MTIEWDDDLTVTLNTLGKTAPGDLAGALFEEGEMIMGKSKRDTPVDSGDLRATGHVESPKVTGGGAEVTLAYGTNYAVFVHEILGATHNVGKAKFLESNMNAAASGMGRRIAGRVKRRWKRRWGNAVR